MRKRWFLVVIAVFVAAMGLLFCHTWNLNAGPPYIMAAAPLEAMLRTDNSPLPPHDVTAGRWVTECVDCPVNTGVISLTGQFQSLSLAVDSQDYVHVAYYRENEGRGHLGYIHLDAEGWHVEIVDTAMAGYPYPGISLALDANDAPHISYYSYNSNTNEQALKYAYRDEMGWQIEAIGDIGTHTSLVLDDDGKPHLSYQDMTGSLMYAYRDTDGWLTQTVHLRTTYWPHPTALALDSDGAPHIGYIAGTELWYAHRGATDWYSRTLDNQVGLDGLSLALDNDDYVHISYDGGSDLAYAYQNASGWHTPTLDSEGTVGDYPSLALDATTGYARISYYEDIYQDGNLKYIYQDVSGWHTQTLDSEGDVGEYTSLGLDSVGYTHITYYDAGNEQLKYAYQDASGWHTRTVRPESTGYVGLYTSLALDEQGYAHISYHDRSKRDLRYAYRDISGWHSQIVDSYRDVGLDTSLALDGDGYPHISYYDATCEDLKYAYQDASGWHSRTVDSEGDVGLYTSLALESTAPYTVHISYYDATNQRAKYAYQAASGWYSQAVGRGFPGGQYTSLALDEEGDPHISYFRHYFGDLVYVERISPTTWLSSTVDYRAEPLKEVGRFSSLALDANGQAHISYQDNGDLKYAHGYATFPAGWPSRTLVDSGPVGAYTSLALDSDEYVHISHYDWRNGNLKYAYQNASGWYSQAVDQAGDVGRYTSLALDHYDHAHISYYDAQQADLRYAYYTTHTLPSVPILLQPPTGTVTTSHAITLRWQAGGELSPDGYNVQLDDEIITTTSTTSPTILVLGVHTWTVRAYNAEGYSAWAAPWTVEITETAPTLPTTPTLHHPQDGTVTTTHAITLSWQAGTGPSPDGYNVRLDDQVVTTTDTTSPTVLALGVHTWTVRAYNAEGYSAWAAPWTVEITETAPTLPTTPTLHHPQDGTVTTTHAITLSWQAGTGPSPDGYNVRLDDQVVTTTDTTSPTVLALGVHTWAVRAYNAEGYSAWAAPWSVEVTETMPTLPGVPRPLHPQDGTVTTTQAITLSWQAGGGPSPDGYNVRLDGEVITTTETISPTALTLGAHTWTVRAYSAAGHSAWASKWKVTVAESTYAVYLPLVLRNH